MNLGSLINAVDTNLQGLALSPAETTALINEAVLKIASGDMVEKLGFQKSPALPSLYKTDTVNTAAGGIVALPSDFNRDVVMVLNSTYDEIPIIKSPKKFLHRYREQNAGAVFTCSVLGKRLLYRDIPATAETLTVHYHSTPATLSASADEPDEIPTHLHRKLIVGYVCREIWNQSEDGLDGQKINTAFYNNEYQEGLAELILEIGIDEDPAYYDVETDYCP